MEENSAEYTALESSESPRSYKSAKVSLLPLVFLIFYEVSGGPFGVEDSVRAAGPLLALVGFLVFPLVWSCSRSTVDSRNGNHVP